MNSAGHPRRGSRTMGSIVIITALAMLTGACTSSSSAAPDASDTVQLQTISLAASAGSIPGLPIYVADETGLFEEEGLDAEILDNLKGGGPIMSALSSGSADIVAQTVSSAAIAYQQGASIPIVAAQSAGMPYVVLVSADSDVPVATEGSEGWQDTVRSLQGAAIGGSGSGSGLDIALRALFEGAGLSASDYNNINVGHGGPEVAALRTGQVDAVLTDSGSALQIEESGAGKAVLTMWEQGPDWLLEQAFAGFVATEETVRTRPELVEKFQSVIDKLWVFFKDPANLPEIKRIAIERSGIADTPGLDGALRSFADGLSGRFTEEQVRITLDFMRATGQLPPDSPVTPRDVVTESVFVE